MLRHGLGSHILITCTVGLALVGCATSRTAIDPGLASRADALSLSETNGEKGTELAFGDFVLHDVGYADLSRVSKDGQVEARDGFTYKLRDTARREWSGACKMSVRGRAGAGEVAVERKADRETLICELGREPASDAGGWRVQLFAGGAENGRKYGDVKQRRTMVEIMSRHEGRTSGGALGPAVGYELTYDDRLVAAIDTSTPKKVVWMDRTLDVEGSGIVAASLASLIVYESMLSR